MYTVDWQAARREIDGVYVSVAGALRSSFAPLALEDVLSVEGPSTVGDSAALEGRPALDGSAAPGGFAALKGSETVQDGENAAGGGSGRRQDRFFGSIGLVFPEGPVGAWRLPRAAEISGVGRARRLCADVVLCAVPTLRVQ